MAIMEYGKNKLLENIARELKIAVGISNNSNLQYDCHIDALCDKLNEANCDHVIKEIEEVKRENGGQTVKQPS